MPHLEIFAQAAGGGTLALSPLPGRCGDYAADLNIVRRWKPDIVLSMTTEVEMAQEGAGSFGPDLAALGVEWVHLPIEDFGTPPAEVETRWPEVSETVRKTLSGNGRVLVHCRGGCGRSGMVVLRLMIECGEGAEAALSRLRAIRPCAVETDGQMAWAKEGDQ